MQVIKIIQMSNTLESLREEIAGLVTKYAKEQYKPQPFIGGETVVPPSGKLLGEEGITKYGGSFFRWLVNHRKI